MWRIMYIHIHVFRTHSHQHQKWGWNMLLDWLWGYHLQSEWSLMIIVLRTKPRTLRPIFAMNWSLISRFNMYDDWSKVFTYVCHKCWLVADLNPLKQFFKGIIIRLLGTQKKHSQKRMTRIIKKSNATDLLRNQRMNGVYCSYAQL